MRLNIRPEASQMKSWYFPVKKIFTEGPLDCELSEIFQKPPLEVEGSILESRIKLAGAAESLLLVLCKAG